MFESVNAHTDGRTLARLVNYKLTSEPSAQVSKKNWGGGGLGGAGWGGVGMDVNEKLKFL